MKIKLIASVLTAFACLLAPVLGQIEAGQSVIIKILGVPAEEKGKIDETYPVSENGTVNMPFVGEIKAAGLKAGALSKSIQHAYREAGIYANPTIHVFANDSETIVKKRIVHLGGHVKSPGPRPYTQGLTVFQAIQAAGGADEFGAMNRVVLWREGKKQEINLKKPEGMAVLAEPADTIQVPQKNIIGN